MGVDEMPLQKTSIDLDNDLWHELGDKVPRCGGSAHSRTVAAGRNTTLRFANPRYTVVARRESRPEIRTIALNQRGNLNGGPVPF